MLRSVLALSIFVSGALLTAGEGKWTDKAELSGVFTNGNSESSNLGLSNKLGWTGGPSSFNFNVSAVRAESTDPETDESTVTAENFAVYLRYARKFSKRTNWYTDLDWRQDEIAGIKSRTGIGAGIGNTWIDTDTRKFNTSYGLKQVKQEDVFEAPTHDDSYIAINLQLNGMASVTKTSTYTSSLNIDANTEESSDYQAVWEHGFAVSVSEKVALKLGLKFNYDNEPAYRAHDMQLDDLDTIFTTSLVINF